MELAEERSLNFIEQIVEKDLQEGKNDDAYKRVSRQSQTVTCILVT
jgi:hypothetical protein